MSFSPFALVRPVACGMTALTALAVAIGRTAPEEAALRRPSPVRYHSINWYHFRQGDPAPRFLDTETGEFVRVPFPKSDHLEYLSCSPWRGRDGQAQVVGLWDDTWGQSEPTGQALGLARYTFPGGRLLDRVPLDVVPTSMPCWYPGNASRVLFGAADGRLYRFAFDDRRRARGTPDDDLLRPRPLTWDTEAPSGGKLWLGDPSWPTDPGLGGRLLVSLLPLEVPAPGQESSKSQAWWLELGPDGTGIVAAGRLGPEHPEAARRWPVLSATPDGSLTLATMVRVGESLGWQLQLSPVVIEPGTGIPRVTRSVAVTQEGKGLGGPPAFSPDGRWVSIVSSSDRAAARIERFDVSATLAERGRRDRDEPGHSSPD